MVILGVDPGTRFAGYACIKKEGQRVFLLESGVFKMAPTLPLHERILLFFTFFSEKIRAYQATTLALETPFMGKNPQNYLKLGYMRGTLYLLAAQHKMALSEFAPREIKQALTGYGGADKAQVARLVAQLFPSYSSRKTLFDETDAIAISLCCLWRCKNYVQL